MDKSRPKTHPGQVRGREGIDLIGDLLSAHPLPVEEDLPTKVLANDTCQVQLLSPHNIPATSHFVVNLALFRQRELQHFGILHLNNPHCNKSYNYHCLLSY